MENAARFNGNGQQQQSKILSFSLEIGKLEIIFFFARKRRRVCVHILICCSWNDLGVWQLWTCQNADWHFIGVAMGASGEDSQRLSANAAEYIFCLDHRSQWIKVNEQIQTFYDLFFTWETPTNFTVKFKMRFGIMNLIILSRCFNYLKKKSKEKYQSNERSARVIKLFEHLYQL